MKNVLMLFLLATSILWSCSKKCDVEKMNYSVNGITDIDYNYKLIQIPIDVTFISGVQEKVDLTISGFPNGFISKFSTKSGIPSFKTILEINHDSIISKGLYPINIECKSESGVIKNFKLNLNVTNDYCSNFWDGTYDMYNVNNGLENGPFPYKLESDTSVVNRLIFYYLPPGDKPVEHFYADLNCINNTLNVPEQRGISGNGTLNNSNMKIELNLSDGSSNWTMKFNRK
jgi:hypothetical protein